MKGHLSRLLIRFLALLPWPLLQGLGRLVGELLTLIPNRQRRDALINLRLCLPELRPDQQRTLRRQAMIEFARTFIEMAALWRWPPRRVLGLVRQVSGVEWFQRPPGQGLVVLGPHLGAWEMAGLYAASQGPITSMYRPQRHVDALIRQGRERSGARLVPDDLSGVKALYRALKRGEMVGILPDQVTRADSGAVFAPFFGVPAVTMLLASGLARRSGARIVFLFAERLPWARGYHLHCLPGDPAIADADPLVAASALNQGVERCIRLAPAQYQWTYRRFRRRPDQAPSPYQGPSV